MSIFLFFFFWALPTYALNNFHWLNDSGISATRITPRSDVKGEYDSDFLAYQKGFAWNYEYLKADLAMDVTVGSLSSKEFLFDQRLKVNKLLTQKFFFELEWLQSRDYDQDLSAFGYEVGYLFFPKVAISAIGTPSYYKSEDDVGGKITIFGEGVKTEIATIWYDFQKNMRSLTAERWANGKAPWALYYQTTWLPKDKKQYTLLGWMHQFHSKSEDVGLGTFTENSAWRGQFQHWEKDNFGVQVKWEQVYRSTQTTDSALRKVLWTQVEKDFYLNRYKVTPGFNVFHRDYYVASDRTTRTTWLPTAWVTLPVTEYESYNSEWSFGTDAAVTHTIEQRLNVKNAFKFHENAELNWMMTFDLQRLISNNLWQGGNMQFRTTF